MFMNKLSMKDYKGITEPIGIKEEIFNGLQESI